MTTENKLSELYSIKDVYLPIRKAVIMSFIWVRLGNRERKRERAELENHVTHFFK